MPFQIWGDDTVAAARTLIGRVTRAISRVLGYMHGPAVFQTRIPSIADPLSINCVSEHVYVCVSALFFTCHIYITQLTTYFFMFRCVGSYFLYQDLYNYSN